MNYCKIDFKKYSCKNLADVVIEALSQKDHMKASAGDFKSRN